MGSHGFLGRLKHRLRLDFIERRVGPALATGQIAFGEARFLGDLVAGLTAPGPIVEVGTLFGWSTTIMALRKAPDRRLVTVDNYVWNPAQLTREQHLALTRAILGEAVRTGEVEMVVQDKDEFYRSYDGPAPSLVFLDADHSYDATVADIHWARSAGADVVCGHDYQPDWPGVMQAVDEAGGCTQKVESLWVLAPLPVPLPR